MGALLKIKPPEFAGWLKPAFYYDFHVGVKLEDLPSVTFNISKKGVSVAAEGEETHGRGDADVNTDHAWIRSVFELTNRPPVLGIDTGGVGVLT